MSCLSTQHGTAHGNQTQDLLIQSPMLYKQVTALSEKKKKMIKNKRYVYYVKSYEPGHEKTRFCLCEDKGAD